MAGRPLAVMSEMKVSQEDVAARAQPWRGVGAGTASRFMANTALSRGARTNGAVCAAPGGSRHRLCYGLTIRKDPADARLIAVRISTASKHRWQPGARARPRLSWQSKII